MSIRRHVASGLIGLALGACSEQAPNKAIVGIPAEPDANVPVVEGPVPSPQRGKPKIVSSQPAQDQTGVHPYQVVINVAGDIDRVFRAHVFFNEPMQTALNSTPITPAISGTIFGAWISPTHYLLTVTRISTVYAPLAEDALYTIDLSALTDAEAESMEPSDAALRFKTGEEDPDLAHTCSHALVGPFQTHDLSNTDQPVPWRSAGESIVHRQYTLTGAETAHMFTPWTASTQRTRTLTIYAPHAFAVHAKDSVSMLEVAGGESQPTPYACDGITHRISLDLVAAPEKQYVLSLRRVVTSPTEPLVFILE